MLSSSSWSPLMNSFTTATKGGVPMIFEVQSSEIKEYVTLIQNIYTATEWTKNDLGWVELRVRDEKVTLTPGGSEPFSYQIVLDTAEPILDGAILIRIHELSNALKTFDHESVSLLIERDGEELRFDDGVYPPEIVILDETNEGTSGFRLEVTEGAEWVEISTVQLGHALAIARQLLRSTFLPASNMVFMGQESGNLYVRAFNMTEMFEARIPASIDIGTSRCLLEKKDVSRFVKALNQLQNKGRVELFFGREWIYVKHGSALFAFPNNRDEESIHMFYQLPFYEMRAHEKGKAVSTEEVKSRMNDLKKRGSENIGFVWDEGGVHLMADERASEIAIPYKSIQRVVSKWPFETVCLKKGIEENISPLIMEGEADRFRCVHIQMGLKREDTRSEEEGHPDAKTA